jgi:hypothetical protein
MHGLQDLNTQMVEIPPWHPPDVIWFWKSIVVGEDPVRIHRRHEGQLLAQAVQYPSINSMHAMNHFQQLCRDKCFVVLSFLNAQTVIAMLCVDRHTRIIALNQRRTWQNLSKRRYNETRRPSVVAWPQFNRIWLAEQQQTYTHGLAQIEDDRQRVLVLYNDACSGVLQCIIEKIHQIVDYSYALVGY